MYHTFGRVFMCQTYWGLSVQGGSKVFHSLPYCTLQIPFSLSKSTKLANTLGEFISLPYLSYVLEYYFIATFWACNRSVVLDNSNNERLLKVEKKTLEITNVLLYDLHLFLRRLWISQSHGFIPKNVRSKHIWSLQIFTTAILYKHRSWGDSARVIKCGNIWQTVCD